MGFGEPIGKPEAVKVLDVVFNSFLCVDQR
jgi:hypothetical protein